jgi:hypothetical protein
LSGRPRHQCGALGLTASHRRGMRESRGRARDSREEGTLVTSDLRQPPSREDQAAGCRVLQLLALVPTVGCVEASETIGAHSTWIARHKRRFDIGDPYGDG